MGLRLGSTPEIRWSIVALILLVIVVLEVAERLGPLVRPADAGPFAATQDLDAMLTVDQFNRGIVTALEPEMIDNIIMRPLFVADRRPIAKVAQSNKAVGEGETRRDGPTIELVGTLLSDRSDVALADHAYDAQRRLRIGDMLDDWKVVEIRRDHLLLKNEDTLRSIELRELR